MKQKKCCVHIHFLVNEIPTAKCPHKYVGDKKEKSRIKIKISDIFCVSFFNVSFMKFGFILSNLNYPSDFYLYSKCSSINFVETNLDIL